MPAIGIPGYSKLTLSDNVTQIESMLLSLGYKLIMT